MGHPAVVDAITGEWSTAAPTVVGPAAANDALRRDATGTAALSDTFTDTNGTGIASHTPDTAVTATTVVTVDATGGTFDITVGGETETLVAFDVTAAALETALEGLASVTAGDVVVTGGPGDAGGTTPYVLTWQEAGLLYGANAPTVTTDATNLTGGAGTAAVTLTTFSWQATGTWEIQTNALEARDATADRAVVYETGLSDVRVSVSINWGIGTGAQSRWQGAVVRCSNLGAETFLRVVPRGADGTRTLRLEEGDGTVLAVFPASSVTVDDGDTDTLSVDCDGDTILVDLNGTAVGSYELTAAQSVTYGSATEHGLYSNEQTATPSGTFDTFTVTALDDPDTSYLSFTEAGIVRYFGYRVAGPEVTDSIIAGLALTLRTSRTGAGTVTARFGVINSAGVVRYAASSSFGVSAPTTGAVTDVASDGGAETSQGVSWETYDRSQFIVELTSVTADTSAAFGTVNVYSTDLDVTFDELPAVSSVAVTATESNPVVSWVYSDPDLDEQDAWQVTVWDPAEITANPTTPLEDLDSLFDSGKRSGQARAGRVTAVLDAATTYTAGVRAWTANVASRPRASEWVTQSFATPAAMDQAPSVAAVVTGTSVAVTVSDPGPAQYAQIERSLDAGTTWDLVATRQEFTGATLEAADSFDRANGGIGDEEGPDTFTWDDEVGTTATIVSNQANVNGSGNVTVDPGVNDIRVSATVDITGPESAVVARWSAANGYVQARVNSATVDLYIWDEVAGSEHATSVTPVQHGVTADTLTLELVCSGDEYVVLVNDRRLIRLIDATVDADIVAATGVGIAGAGATGDHVFDNFLAEALDSTVVYTDRTTGEQADIRYRAITKHVSSDGALLRSALSAASSTVAVTEAVWQLTSLTSGDSVEMTYLQQASLRYPRAEAGDNATGLLQAGMFTVVTWTLTQTDHDELLALLGDTGLLRLSDVFGNSWIVRNTDGVDVIPTDKIAAPTGSVPVRHSHEFVFALKVATV